MKIVEAFRHAKSTFVAALNGRYEENLGSGYKIRGDVFFKLRDGKTGELQEERHLKNVVTLDASVLIARLVRDPSEPAHGAFCLAVGTGDTGWNPMAPPAATNTQRSLYAELTRKTFTNTQFIDGGGAPTAIPTPVIDFSCTLSESEGVGPLVEMGILAPLSSNMAVQNPVLPPNGPYDPTRDLTNYDTLVNALFFPVVNKPATSTLTIVWRLTF